MSVVGVRAAGSLGIANYCDRLAASLGAMGLDYVPAAEPARHGANHLHLGNSSRSVVGQAMRLRRPFVVTVHDIIPRDRRLMPLYRLAVYPGVVRRAAKVIVHSELAAEMLRTLARVRSGRIEVIAHPVTRPPEPDRAAARRALGWADDDVVAVLPGVLKSAKLVRDALAATAGLTGIRLVLVGRVGDPSLLSEAALAGVQVIAGPDDLTYQRAVVGSDAVLVLRDGTVGETNGPLLDALGAGRPVIATRSGSIPEVAEDAAIYVAPDATSIREALLQVAHPATRCDLERHASRRADALAPESAAQAHADLFAEVFDG